MIELIWDFREAVLANGRRVQLDMTEAKLLRYLISAAPGLVKTDRLALDIFGNSDKKNCVGAYIARLRKKVGRSAIRNVVGVGYRIAQEPAR